jgi:hypothetical protein
MTQAAATETAVIRPALPEFAATVETMYDYRSGKDGYVIRKADGALYEVGGPYGSGYPMYDTAAAAQEFIDAGGLIEVEIVNTTAVIAASGWVDDEGFSDANCDRLRNYCQVEGIHYYAAPKEDFFEFIGRQQAQKLGLRKMCLENLS